MRDLSPGVALALAVVVAAAAPTVAAGQDAAPSLGTYLDALAKKRWIAPEGGTVHRMREIVRAGERAHLDGRDEEAALLLFEVVENPSFADFVDDDGFRGAEYMLARSLARLRAVRTARRYLLGILRRGPTDPFFGPAYRAYVDTALESGRPGDAVDDLVALGLDSLPEDARNELAYLRGRILYDANRGKAASREFHSITKRSRFYANAQYLLGVLMAKEGKLSKAEGYFCAIADAGKDGTYPFYVDGRYFEVKDLAFLALGRVAHEGRRSEDAFYYYFQVPQDSNRVAQALFEAAYAMYEGGQPETAIDLLDQLDARYPNTAFSDEASLLRGYVHLDRCEFDEADREFRRFQQRFGPVLEETVRILDDPSRIADLHGRLLMEERYRQRRLQGGEVDEMPARPPSVETTLLALLSVDPAFYRIHADLRALDAEASRAGRLSEDLAALEGRVAGKDRPAPAAVSSETPEDPTAALRAGLARAREALVALRDQLKALRAAGAPAERWTPLEREGRRLSGVTTELERRLALAAVGSGSAAVGGEASAMGKDLPSLLARDRSIASTLPGRVETLRGRMLDAGQGVAQRSLADLRQRLATELRRARIGRIDAIMGSKRRVELQVESLAAGRFPPELFDPLRMQGLLRDDEEYWPFEGELWEDEFEEDP
ncbi:MAG: hypothetical protein KC416_11290 [Myxococcales bacterium]|nr:hypothetical protein [Myxococcales bacterium]